MNIIKLEISIPEDSVLKRLGYKKGKSLLHNPIKKLLKEEFSEARNLIDAKGIYERFKLKWEEKYRFIIDGKLLIKSLKLSKWIQGCSEIIIMAVTIGESILKRREKLMQKEEIARAMIIDAIGSETVERAAELLNKKIAETCPFQLKKRYSPGYGDLDLSYQKPLLEMIESYRIGINIDEYFNMTPEKSISAIIGVMREIG